MAPDASPSAFAYKYEFVPDILSKWAGRYLDFGNSDVFEFGCGDAAVALGFVNKFKPRSFVGVEVVPNFVKGLEEARELGYEIPEGLELRLIQAGELAKPGETFDFIYNWSVMEHVHQPLLEPIIKGFFEILRPGGYLFIQIDPLFYSAWGHHLQGEVSTPWVHLTTQQNILKWDVIKKAGEKMWNIYEGLNRLSAPYLLELADKAGFKLVRDYYTYDEEEIPKSIKGIYNEEMIKTQQVVGLWRKP